MSRAEVKNKIIHCSRAEIEKEECRERGIERDRGI
jgi:hypothetical protein